jgi:hypothetical protein
VLPSPASTNTLPKRRWLTMSEQQMHLVALVLAALKNASVEERMDVLALACAAYLQGAVK